jgi:D-lactate dehydrogenase (cytochrome)
MRQASAAVDADSPGFAAAAAELAARFRDRFIVDGRTRCQHADSAGWLAPQAPQGVVYAQVTADIRDLLLICGRHEVPVIPYGGGTSVEGQVNAPLGGVCVDLSRMDKVLGISADNLTVTVQPGLRREQLNESLLPHGLFFPVDPGANATLGGMAATRASGTRAVGYGTMRENVACARIMLASGVEIKAGTEAVKSAAGYDLLSLFVGSEGTLGIFTELTVRLYPIPEHAVTGSAAFASVPAAVRAAIATRPRQHGVTRIELLDTASIRAANQYSGLGLPAEVHVFFEVSGSRPRVTAEMAWLTEIFRDHGASMIQVAEDAVGRRRLWQARHEIWWATHSAFPDRIGLPTDVCVPLARLAECIEFAIEEADRAGLIAPLCGHVGDGNFHTLVMVEETDTIALRKASAFSESLARRAIELGGTCSGEHGIGQGKRFLMPLEHGAGHHVMARVKDALDPQGILNPAKIIGGAEGAKAYPDT